MSSVIFNNADIHFIFSQKNKIKHFLKRIFLLENTILKRLDFVFCTDEYLLAINKEYLNHDFYTDVITFDLSEEKYNGIYGEVYISLERIKENAFLNKVDFDNELLRVMIHASLHLCGYIDKSVIQKESMTKKENYYLQLFEAFHVETK